MGSIPVGSTKKKRPFGLFFFGAPDGNSVPARFIAQGAQVFGKAENLTSKTQVFAANFVKIISFSI